MNARKAVLVRPGRLAPSRAAGRYRAQPKRCLGCGVGLDFWGRWPVAASRVVRPDHDTDCPYGKGC